MELSGIAYGISIKIAKIQAVSAVGCKEHDQTILA
jgi:hypothetical protein